MRTTRQDGRVTVYRDGCLVLSVTDAEARLLARDLRVDERVRTALKAI